MKTRQAVRSKFKISDEVLEKIKVPSIRRKLADALNVTDQAIVNYINRNDDNLTKVAAMIVIRQETEMVDEEILVVST